MAKTTIADLWVPDIWVRGTNERANSMPSIINSGIAVRSDKFNEIASGGGVAVNVPFFKDISDLDDEIQVEDTAPTVNAVTHGMQIAPMLNRVSAIGATALSAGVSGEDPVAFAVSQIASVRLKQRQKTLVNELRGVFATALAAMSNDAFDESGVGALAAHLIDGVKVIDTWALMGELQGDLSNGAMLCHPDIRAALLAQDENDFERTSQGAFMLERYKGVPVYVSNLLRRAGTTDGYVYDSYFFAPGVVAVGEKPQMGDVIDVASLQFDQEKDKNNQTIYDRTRFLMHLNGTKWVGTPAGQSATNAELAAGGNWQLVYQSADRCGVARIRTNG